MDVEREVKNIVSDVQAYFNKAGKKRAVIGNSGGKDSAVVIALLSLALGSENVLAITLPCHSIDKDRSDAEEVAKSFNVRCINIALDDVYDALEKNAQESYGEVLSTESKINIKPRLRMTTLYAIAATFDALVVGTGNKCEAYIGYFTKYGDGACDYNPLAEYFVSEVYELASYFEKMPKFILSKAPSDGISGLSDEEKIGVPYSKVEEYIKTGKTDEDSQKIIVRMHNASSHKRSMPVKYDRK